jgi:predicted Holliday junction resolvase-like endonuclease
MATEWLIILILVIALLFLFSKYSDLKGKIENRSRELLDDWKQKELNQIKSQFEMQSKQAIQETENIRVQLKKQTDKAIQETENIRVQLKKQTDKAIEDTENIRIGLQKQIEQTKIQLEEQSKKNAQLLLEEWMQKEEERIRKDAINKSKSVIIGKVTEYLVPFFPGFKYNPKDVRFIGTPIDVIVFDGLDEGNIRQIVFGEIKTGKYGYLTSREKSIKNIIENKNVKHEIIHIETDQDGQNDINIIDIPQQKVLEEDNRYLQAISPHIAWIKEEIKKHTNRKIIMRSSDVAKELGGQFINESPENIYIGLKPTLLKEGIMVEMGEHKSGEKLLIMRMV